MSKAMCFFCAVSSTDKSCGLYDERYRTEKEKKEMGKKKKKRETPT
jgi:hypothetical protein